MLFSFRTGNSSGRVQFVSGEPAWAATYFLWLLIMTLFLYNGKYKKEGIYSPITQNTRHLEMIKKIRLAKRNNFFYRNIFWHCLCGEIISSLES